MKTTEMSKRQKFYLMAVTAFWGALLYAVGWGLVSSFTSVPSYYSVAINGYFSITINRWFDIILLPVYLNLILSVYIWLIPMLVVKYKLDYEGLVVGLAVGLGAGLVVGLAVGLLGAGLVVGLGAGLVTLVKVVVNLHKKAFIKIK